MIKRKDKAIKPTEKELDYLIGLLQVVDSDIKSSKAIGMKVEKEEEKLVNSLNRKFQSLM